MMTVWVLVGLLFGSTEGVTGNMQVYGDQASCIAAEKALMNSALDTTNSTPLVPAAKCVPLKVPTRT
jgi:hypothetical protein